MQHYDAGNQRTGAAFGGLGVPGNQLVDATQINGLNNRLSACAQQMQELAGRIGAVLDRLRGPVPEPVQKGGETGSAGGELGRAFSSVDTMDALLNIAHARMSDLERIA